MKRKTVEAISLILVLISIITTVAPGALCTRAYAVSGQDITDEITGILRGELIANNASSVQELIDGHYSEKAGISSDWFVFSIIQYAGSKYDYASYAAALKNYIKKSASNTSPTTKERYALNFAAMGTNSAYVKKIANEEIGELGIMSNVFGLHLITNGFSSSKYTADEVVEKLLSEQYEDGGWALNTSVGVSDTDITAMTVQCLAAYYGRPAVKTAVDKAVNLLSTKQSDDGGFSSYYSTKNPESAAQVIVALTSLGINPLTDSRFIKNENSAVDFMLSFRATDHGFAHTSGGTYNISATTQVLYSLVSIYRLQHNKGRLYELNAGVKTVIPEETTTAPSTAAPVVPATPATPAKPVSGGSPSGPSTTKATTAATTAQTKPAAKQTQAVSRTKREITHRTTEPKTPQSETAKQQTKKSPAKAPVTSAKAAATGETMTVTVSQSSAVTENAAYELTSAFQEDENITEEETAQPETSQSETEKDENRISLKTACVVAVWLAALIACVILFARGNRKIINYIIIAVLAGVVTAGISISDIRRPGEFYTVEEEAPLTDTVTVTMSIDCKTVAGRGDEKITPSDGIILEKTQFTLPEGSTAYDCLIYASKKYKIAIEDSSKMLNDHRSAYIAGINYLFEFDYGEMSGWMFSVNGTFGEVGCGEYTLSEGDNIEWRYTTNIGEDLR